ncbi:MAG: DUF4974 domain-containing protein [Planctomycetes bacterium]|nr:DUF4974 domain-containing protein [Planctomycetota bacterium]
MSTPRRRVASIVLVALLAALLAVSWRLRGPSRGASASADPAGTGAPPPAAVVAKKPPAWDFPKQTGMRVTPMTEGEKADPTSPPHPLDAEIAAREARLKPWRETKVDLNYTDTPLADVLADLAKRYGLKLIVSPGLDMEFKTVTFKVDQLSADQALDLIFKMADLRYTITSDGSMVVLEKDGDAAPWAVKDSDELRGLEEALGQCDSQGQEAKEDAANAMFLASVNDKKLSTAVAPARLWDSLDALQEDLKVNIVISFWARKEYPADRPIPELPAGRSGAETFDAYTSAAELDWMARNGTVFLGKHEEVAEEREKQDKRTAGRKQQEDALAALLARPVEIGGENLAIRDVADLLGQALGVPVRVDPVTWHRAARLAFDRASRPASEIVAALKSAAPVRVVFREGTLWFLGPAPVGPQ